MFNTLIDQTKILVMIIMGAHLGHFASHHAALPVQSLQLLFQKMHLWTSGRKYNIVGNFDAKIRNMLLVPCDSHQRGVVPQAALLRYDYCTWPMAVFQPKKMNVSYTNHCCSVCKGDGGNPDVVLLCLRQRVLVGKWS